MRLMALFSSQLFSPNTKTLEATERLNKGECIQFSKQLLKMQCEKTNIPIFSTSNLKLILWLWRQLWASLSRMQYLTSSISCSGFLWGGEIVLFPGLHTCIQFTKVLKYERDMQHKTNLRFKFIIYPGFRRFWLLWSATANEDFVMFTSFFKILFS